MAVLAVVINQHLIDVVIGRKLPQEFKPEGLVEGGKVGGYVADQPEYGEEKYQHHYDLDGDAARLFLPPDA
jgi:hypothetical protein